MGMVEEGIGVGVVEGSENRDGGRVAYLLGVWPRLPPKGGIAVGAPELHGVTL